MEDAIKKSEKGSTTITSRREKSGFENPAIIICPYPGFKPSLSQKLEYAAKDLFKLKTQDKSFFDDKTVPEVFEEYTYKEYPEYVGHFLLEFLIRNSSKK